jgi:molybdopterin synthase catalytic subunit
MSTMKISVQTEDFDVSAELAALRLHNPTIGAIVNFVGVVRDLNEGCGVSQLELEHYPGMTEASLKNITMEAKARWHFIDSVIIHRVGVLQPLDQIVLVAVASAHRGDAFAACEFMMDFLKTRAPFWKKETTSQGAKWLDARASDEAALKKWQIVSETPDQSNVHAVASIIDATTGTLS